MHGLSSALPFALIASDGLGASAAAQDSFLPHQAFGQAKIAATVNLSTGNLFLQDRLFHFPDRGGAVEFSYRYNSLGKPNWQLAYGRQLKKIADGYLVTAPDGHEVKYTRNLADNRYYADDYQDGCPYLQFINGTLTWYDPASRCSSTFSHDHMLIASFDAAGNKTTYEHKNGRLQAIVAASGVRYEFKSTQDQTEIILNKEGQKQRLHTYTFSDGDLSASITNDGYETRYHYQDKLLKTVTQTDKSELSFGFSKGKIASIQVGNSSDNTFRLHYVSNKTEMIDPAGSKSTLNYDAKKRPVSWAHYLDEQHYQFFPSGQLQAINYRDGSLETCEYEPAHGLLKKKRERDGSTVSFHYSNDSKPRLLKEIRSDQTGKTFPTYYIYQQLDKGACVLHYQISASGRVKEYIVDPSNGLIKGIKHYCENFFPVARVEPVASVMPAWLKFIAPAKTTFSAYDRDQQGRIKSVKKYVDDEKVGQTEHYEYDDYGHTTQTKTEIRPGQYVVEETKYDDLGRQTQKIRVNKQQRCEYQQNHIIEHLANGRKDTVQLDSAGCMATVSQQSAEASYEPIIKHRAVVSTDAEQNVSVQFYDEDRQLKANVSAEGAVTRIVSDSIKIMPLQKETNSSYHPSSRANIARYEVITQYAKKIDPHAIYTQASYYHPLTWIQGQQKPQPSFEKLQALLANNADAAKDRITTTFYGFNNEIRYEIDAENYLTEYRYNALGKRTHSIQYQDKISARELANLKAGAALDRLPNRHTDIIDSNFYDDDGYLIASQDPAGFIKEHKRDAAGRITASITYHTPILEWRDDFIRPPDTSKDSYHYYFYDALDHCILEVDAEGFVTTHSYEADGKEKSSKRYANKVAADWYDNTKALPVMDASAEDQEKMIEYDDLRRISAIHYSSGARDTFAYDEMDNVTVKETQDARNPDCNDGDHLRGIKNDYDAWGNQSVHANPFVYQKLKKEPSRLDLLARNSHTKTGLKIKSTDSLGAVTRFYYDKDKHPVLSIGPMGAITEWINNAFGECVVEHHYYTPLPLETSAALNGGYVDEALLSRIHALKHPKDAITQFKRNQRGLIVEKIDAEENISTFTHDAFKRCVEENLPVADKNPSLRLKHKFEQRGLEIKTTRQAGDDKIITQNQYQHPLGLKTDHYDAVGGHTQYGHDRVGAHIATIKQGENGGNIAVEVIKRDAFSRPIAITNADQETVTIAYSHAARSKTMTPANYPEQQSIVKYNIFGETIAVRKESNGVVLQEERFTHAPDGQLATHTDGLMNEEQTAFNLRGEKIAEINQNKSKTTYVRNNAGRITDKIVDDDEGGLQLKTTIELNALGDEEKITNARGYVTKNAFNRKGEISKSTHEGQSTSAFTRNAQGDITDSIQGDVRTPDQYHEKLERDGFNRVIAKIVDPQDLKLKTSVEHDAVGNITKTIDPKGYQQQCFYNRLGQKRFEIKQLRENQFAASEYQYTAGGKPKSIHHFALSLDKAIPETNTFADIAKMLHPSRQDAITQFFYDDQGREQFKLNLIAVHESKQWQAVVEENGYDGANRLNKTTRYAERIGITEGEQLSSTDIAERIKTIADPKKDRSSYRWYNKAGKEALSINARGRVTETQYRAGLICKQIEHYHALPNPAQHLDEPLATVCAQILPHASDRITHYLRDSIGRLLFKVLPNGAVIAYRHDENSNQTEICEYKDPIQVPDNEDALLLMLRALKPDQSKDSITKKTYDTRDNLETVTDALGNTDTYERDALGNLTAHIDRAQQRFEFTIDRAKRLTHETSPLTTVSQVIKKDGKLEAIDFKTKITKKTDWDENNNPIRITEGLIDEKLAIQSNAAIKDHLPRSREFIASYQADQQLVGTSVKAEIDDETKACDALSALPEKAAVISTQIIHDLQGRKIAACDEAGIWSFWIRDNLGQVVYEIQNETAIIQYTHNNFGEIEAERHFATPLACDLQQFIKTGISLADIGKLAITENEADRLTIYERDQSGNVTRIRRGPVYFYSQGEFGKASPETKFAYTIFDEPILEAKLIRPGVWAEKHTWVDLKGDPIAILDENNYLVTYARNAAGKEIERIEYAQALKANLADIDSVSALIAAIEKSPKDRKIISDYDQLNQKTSERIMERDGSSDDSIDPLTHKLGFENNVAKLEEQREPIIKKWAYTPRQSLASTTYEDGGVEYHYHDERDIQIAETNVLRTDAISHEKIIPLTLTKPDVFGKTVVTQQSAKGCKGAEGHTIPTFIDTDAINETLTLNDKRGLASLLQTANGALTARTYYPDRNMAREIKSVHTWHYQPGMSLSQDEILDNKKIDSSKRSQHIDEKKIQYDKGKHPTAVFLLRDGFLQEKQISRSNVFGEVIAEGDDENHLPLYRKIDTNGHTWSSNAEGGAKSIVLNDLRGAYTLSLQAGKDDLALFAYEQLPDLLDKKKYPRTRVERTEHDYDAGGLLSATKAPWAKTEITRAFKRDHWGNVTHEENSLGEASDKEYNFRDQEIKSIAPLVGYYTPDNFYQQARPQTLTGYNIRGANIGICDANGHTKAFILDEANQLIATILGDGTKTQMRQLNALGLITDIYDARSLHWQYIHHKGGEVALFIPPNKQAIGYTYDEKKNRNSMTNLATAATWFFNHSSKDDIVEQILPEGQQTLTKYDSNHQPLTVLNPDGSQLSWQRSYFGEPEEHTDLVGKKHTLRYDFSRRLTSKISTNTPVRPFMFLASSPHYIDEYNFRDRTGKLLQDRERRFPLVYNQATPQTVGQENITYQHQDGLLKSVIDGGIGKITNYENDSEGRHFDKKITDLQGNLLDHLAVTYDSHSRETMLYNKHRTLSSFYAVMKAYNAFDAVGNRKRNDYDLDAPGYCQSCRYPSQVQSFWHSYDAADRIKIQNGVLQGQQITLSPQSVGYDYQANLRNRETRPGILVDIGYDENERIRQTVSNVGVDTVSVYHASGLVDEYWEGNRNKGVTTVQKIYDINRNGWHQAESFHDNGELKSKRWWTPRADGLPLMQTTELYVKDRRDRVQIITDRLQFEYFGVDSWQPSTVTGTRTHQGTTEPMTAQLFYDANATENGKLYSEDEMVDPQIDWPRVVFDTTTDGSILSKSYITSNKRLDKNAVHGFYYLHDMQQNVLGGYSLRSILMGQALHAKGHLLHDAGVQNHPDLNGFFPYPTVKSIGKFALTDHQAKNNPLKWDEPHHPFKGATFYTVAVGDTLIKIALNMFGDIEAADEIAKLNGLLDGPAASVLKPGMVLHLPQYLSAHNHADNNRPYHEFKHLIVGAISPHLPTPYKRQRVNYLALIAKVLALAIVMAAANWTAGFLLAEGGVLASLGITGAYAKAAVVAILAALGDASVQGLAILGHMESKFSWAEVLETAMTAGVGNALGRIGDLKNIAEIASYALKLATAAATTQLVEMRLGIRKKFDVRAIVMQVTAEVGSQYIEAGVAQVTKGLGARTGAVVSRAAKGMANAVLGNQVMGTPIDIQHIAAGVIGESVGSEVAQMLPPIPTPDAPPPSSGVVAELDDVEINVPTAKLPIGDASYALSELNYKKMAAAQRGFWGGIYDNATEKVEGAVETLKWASRHPNDAWTGIKSTFEEHLDDQMHPNRMLEKMKEQGDDFNQSVHNLQDDIKNGNYNSLGHVTEDVATMLFPFSKVLGLAKFGVFATTGMKGGDNIFKEISPFKLNPTEPLSMSKREFNRFLEKIKSDGIQESIKYVEYNGEKYVVDGHHRLQASKILGINNVPIEKVKLPYKGYKNEKDLLNFGL